VGRAKRLALGNIQLLLGRVGAIIENENADEISS
jgi:hypothetical protein